MKFCDFLAQRVEKLSILYAHPDDVDFTVGGSLEAHAPGTLAGPTFLCILLEPFYRTRVSDRYFYEFGGQPESFSPGNFFSRKFWLCFWKGKNWVLIVENFSEQLHEIKKASLARLFCDNGDDIHTMQPSAFLVISDE